MVNRPPKISFLLALVLLIAGTTLEAQPDIIWTKVWDRSGSERLFDVRSLGEDGFIFAGISNGDGWLIRTDAQGDTLWTQTYGGEGEDAFASVCTLGDTGFIVTGTTSSVPPEKATDVWLLRLATNGDTLWTRTYGGLDYEAAHCLHVSEDGAVIFGGEVSGSDDVWLIRTNLSGDTLWTRTYGTADKDWVRSVTMTPDSGYIFAGSVDGSFEIGGSDAWVIRTNADGDTLWTRTYGGPGYDNTTDVHVLDDGGFIFAGVTTERTGADMDMWLVRTDMNGDTLWTRSIGGSGHDRGRSIEPADRGGFAIAGQTYQERIDQYNAWLVYTDSLGNVIRAPILSNGDYDFFEVIQPTGDGGFILTGATRSYLSPSASDALAIRVRPVDNHQPQPFHLLAPAIESRIVCEPGPQGWVPINFAWSAAIDPDGDSTLYQFRTECDYQELFTDVDTRDTSIYLIPLYAVLLKQMATDSLEVIWDVSAWDSVGDHVFAQNAPISFTLVFDYVGEVEYGGGDLPNTYALHPAYPNPFNPTTTIIYELPQAAQVTLTLYDLLGREVAPLVEGYIQPGMHEVVWDGGSFPSGIYLAQLVTPGYSKTIKLVLLK
jgi:hypothetical protein